MGIFGVLCKNSQFNSSFIKNIVTKNNDFNVKNYFYNDSNIQIVQSTIKIDFLKENNSLIYNKNHSIVCFVDGIISNYDSLKDLLEMKGYRFNTFNKYEIIPFLYEVYGVSLFSYLEGKFSIVIWDTNTKKLIIGIDDFALKPIYYVKTKDFFMFSSDVNGILRTNLVKPKPNWQEIYNYLSLPSTYGVETIFQGINKLLGKSYIILKENKLFVKEYTKLFLQKKEKYSYLKHKDILSNAINNSFLENKKVGILLSGGVDSSVLTLLAKEAGNEFKTYSTGYDVDTKGDLYYSKKVSEQLDIPNKQFIIESKEITKMNDMALSNQLFLPEAFATYFAFKMVQKKEKLILMGTGADEVYSYFSHTDQLMVKAKLINKFIPNIAKDYLKPNEKVYASKYDKTKILVLATNDFERRINLFSDFNYYEKNMLLTNNNFIETPKYVEKLYNDYKITKDVDSFLFFENVLIRNCTSHTNSVSVEVNYPYLDYKLINLMKNASYLQKSFPYLKAPLKNILKPNLSRDIIFRDKSSSVASNAFFAEQKDFLFDRLDKLSLRKGFNKEGIERLKKSVDTYKYWYKVFCLASLESWFEVFMDKENLYL